MDIIDYKKQNESLGKMVIDLLDTQHLFYKTRNVEHLKKAKALEKIIRKFIEPKQVEQTSIAFNEYLAK